VSDARLLAGQPREASRVAEDAELRSRGRSGVGVARA